MPGAMQQPYGWQSTISTGLSIGSMPSWLQGMVARVWRSRSSGSMRAQRTCKELSLASNKVANALRGMGIAKGNHILLTLSNRAELWEVRLAAMKLGVITIATTTLATPVNVIARVLQAGASAIVTSYDLAS